MPEEWTSLPSMGNARRGHAAVKMRGLIYVIGGVDVSSVEVYNPASRQWSILPPMLNKRVGCAAVELDGLIYVVGGFNKGDRLSSMEMYNPTARQWSLCPPMHTKRFCCAAVQVNGLIYVIGGTTSNCLSSMEVYNPTTRQWILLPSMHTKRSACAAVEVGGLIYVVGGYDGSNILSSMEAYNPTTMQWSILPSMSIERSGLASVEVGGQIYVIGGTDKGRNEFSSVEVYNPNTQQWSFLPSMNTNRRGCAAVELGGAIYAIGGRDGTTALSSVEALQVNLQPPESHIQPQAAMSLSSTIPPQEELAQLDPTSMPAMAGSQPDQIPSSQLPQTLQLLQSKIPTADFTPVAAEVVQVEGTYASQPLAAIPVGQNLSNATTEEVCQWLSKHGISKVSLDILRREEIDGVFLFKESPDEIKSVLKEEGMKAGQISRIRNAVEEAKRVGSLV